MVSKTKLLIAGSIGVLLMLMFLSIQLVLSLKVLAWCIVGALVAAFLFVLLFGQFEIVVPIGRKKRK